MIQNVESLISDFWQAAALAHLSSSKMAIEHEQQLAPHTPHALPKGKCALYVFSLSESYGGSCPAGAHRVLKVGKAGSNSNPRFQYQHYNPSSAESTLSGSIWGCRVLWPYLGIAEIPDVGGWIRTCADRDNFYLEQSAGSVLHELERYMRGRLGPVFEGG
ncbi:MAG: hypothetical protein Q8P22_09265 [Chloroflexota bacterium]|nr:hypothetical protein [Chloroflexota bacterium]